MIPLLAAKVRLSIVEWSLHWHISIRRRRFSCDKSLPPPQSLTVGTQRGSTLSVDIEWWRVPNQEHRYRSSIILLVLCSVGTTASSRKCLWCGTVRHTTGCLLDMSVLGLPLVAALGVLPRASLRGYIHAILLGGIAKGYSQGALTKGAP